MNNWKKAVTFITLMFLSLLGVKTTSASTTTKATPTPALNNEETLLAQRCPSGVNRLTYAKVRTQSGSFLNIRSAPNGSIIGQVPNGWAVVTGRQDRTRQWTYLDYGTYYRYPSYASAPRLRSGWVSTEYLRPIGRRCEKPVAFMRGDLNALSGKKILVNEDWTQIGDRISRAINKQHG